LFSFQGSVVPTPLRRRAWNFYPFSALLVDQDGENVGRIGVSDSSVCITLTGGGCKRVMSWKKTFVECGYLRARITRVDVAHDDYDGDRIDVHSMLALARLGAFKSRGRPPTFRFLSDEGHGTGST